MARCYRLEDNLAVCADSAEDSLESSNEENVSDGSHNADDEVNEVIIQLDIDRDFDVSGVPMVIICIWVIHAPEGCLLRRKIPPRLSFVTILRRKTNATSPYTIIIFINAISTYTITLFDHREGRLLSRFWLV